MSEFFNLYSHGYFRAALGTPRVRVGDPKANAAATLELMRQAARQKAIVAVFPELGLSAYSCEDLFHQQALLGATEAALEWLLAKSRSLPIAAFVGLPVSVDGLLYNGAALICRGRLLGVTPKTYLPNYREFYELRQFTPGGDKLREISLAGQAVPFGPLIYKSRELPKLRLFAEICEDLWVPAPPSSFAALAGATVIANLSASNVVIGKHGYRQQLAANQSARCLAAYLFTAAGTGESTTDLAWDGQAEIFENGELLAETERFPTGDEMAVADVDLDLIRQERARMGTFDDNRRSALKVSA
jgi:NAD+ synthase (glutamine-hydrolysing)